MNDARVDTPGTGSSSVDAYEEDWYRSLRALAERRRTELEQFEDEEQQESATDSAAETEADAGARVEDAGVPEVDETTAPPEMEPAAPEIERPTEPGDTSVPQTESDLEAVTPDDHAVSSAPEDGPIGPATEDAPIAEMRADEATGAQPSSPPTGVIAEAESDTEAVPVDLGIASEPEPEAEAIDDAVAEATGTGTPGTVASEEVLDLAPARDTDDEIAAEAEAAPNIEASSDLSAAAPPVSETDKRDADAVSGRPVEVAAAEPEPEPEPAYEPEAEPEPEPEPAGPSLTSRDPAERREALIALADEPSAAELDAVAALVLDPEAEIRRLAVEALSRTPSRIDDAVVRQALQDPADEVRAAAVRAAATRGLRDLPLLATLLDSRRSPETQRAVLQLLPKILGSAQLVEDDLDPLLLAVAQMPSPPEDIERAGLDDIARAIGTPLLVEALTLPDIRRLGAVRLLAGDRSQPVLHAIAARAGDPLEEVRQAGVAAADEIARAEAEAAAAEAEALPPDIGELADALRSPDPQQVEHALTALAGIDRSSVVGWCRERLAHADAESVAAVASVAAVLDLNEIGVELLTRGAALPAERRRPVVEALADFPEPSTLAGFLAVVPTERRADGVHLVWEAAGRRVLSDLRTLLSDPAVDVRVAVIDVIRDADDPASIEAVASLLTTDSSPGVRAAAVRAVARTDGSLPHVIRALGDPDPHVRATAVASLPPEPASEVGPLLAQALTDLDERVRLAAVERLAGVSSGDPALAWSALRRCPEQERTELLDAFHRSNPTLILDIALEHAYSTDQDERRLAVEITGWAGNQAAVEAGIRALGDPVPEVRRAAVGALGRLRDRSAVSALGKTLADPDPDVRVGAVRALGVIDDEAVLSFLVAALKDPDARVRETTSHVLTEWSSPAVAKRLAGVLAVPSLRDSAADLLRRIGPTSVELLIDVLLQGNIELRSTVGPLLEQIIGIDEFLGRMDSLDPERRLRAIEALGAIAGPLAVDALMRALSDPDERIRLRATQILGELGDPIAADAVRGLIEDPVGEVADAARFALETQLDTRGAGRAYD